MEGLAVILVSAMLEVSFLGLLLKRIIAKAYGSIFLCAKQFFYDRHDNPPYGKRYVKMMITVQNRLIIHDLRRMRLMSKESV